MTLAAFASATFDEAGDAIGFSSQNVFIMSDAIGLFVTGIKGKSIPIRISKVSSYQGRNHG